MHLSGGLCHRVLVTPAWRNTQEGLGHHQWNIICVFSTSFWLFISRHDLVWLFWNKHLCVRKDFLPSYTRTLTVRQISKACLNLVQQTLANHDVVRTQMNSILNNCKCRV